MFSPFLYFLFCEGDMWWQVPKVSRVQLDGVLPSHSSGKDVIVALVIFFVERSIFEILDLMPPSTIFEI